jgi:hypothetical protein
LNQDSFLSSDGGDNLNEGEIENENEIIFKSLYASILSQKSIQIFQNNIEKSSSVFQRKLKQ